MASGVKDDVRDGIRAYNVHAADGLKIGEGRVVEESKELPTRGKGEDNVVAGFTVSDVRNV